jgi:hypothetical protein
VEQSALGARGSPVHARIELTLPTPLPPGANNEKTLRKLHSDVNTKRESPTIRGFCNFSALNLSNIKRLRFGILLNVASAGAVS